MVQKQAEGVGEGLVRLYKNGYTPPGQWPRYWAQDRAECADAVLPAPRQVLACFLVVRSPGAGTSGQSAVWARPGTPRGAGTIPELHMQPVAEPQTADAAAAWGRVAIDQTTPPISSQMIGGCIKNSLRSLYFRSKRWR